MHSFPGIDAQALDFIYLFVFVWAIIDLTKVRVLEGGSFENMFQQGLEVLRGHVVCLLEIKLKCSGSQKSK